MLSTGDRQKGFREIDWMEDVADELSTTPVSEGCEGASIVNEGVCIVHSL